MAQTTDQVKAEIVQTREQLGATIDAIVEHVETTKRRIPFYGMQRKHLFVIAGGVLAVTAGLAFMAFYGRNLRTDHGMVHVRMSFRNRGSSRKS